ncbi:DNA topoisomerase [Xanthomonas euvesicatoria]
MAELEFAFVAEKPKLGRAIAEELARRSPVVDQGINFIRGRDWAVAWAQGHIYQLEEPDFYLKELHPNAAVGTNGKLKWDRTHLPLLPEPGRYTLKATNAKLLPAIRKIIGECRTVVHAGDPDREGQLVVDEILETLGNRKPVKRVLISGLDEVSVRDGLASLRDNKEFAAQSSAARARSRADWAVGMNITRALTLRANDFGFKGYIPYGRVQTAVLSLIVMREREILNFKPVDYFTLTADMAVRAGSFKAQWVPKKGQHGMDADGRLIDQAVARSLQQIVVGKVGEITSYEDAKKFEAAPLPFSLAQLQMLASKRFGYKSDATLKAVQELYDAKYVSYPRTGSQHLPSGLFAHASATLDIATRALGLNSSTSAEINPEQKSKAWDDSKVKGHHGLVPLTKGPDLSALTPIQRHIYLEICKRYVAQFMPPRQYRSVTAVVSVAGENFKANGATTIAPGWKALYGDEGEGADAESKLLPQMKLGEAAKCNGLQVASKRTEPPRRFTDSTLTAAMLKVEDYVSDARIKAIFKRMRQDEATDEDVGGIGTPATRQTFVPKLEETGLVTTQKPTGKSKEETFHPTATSMALMSAIPPDLGLPDTTAMWESVFEKIEDGKATEVEFLKVLGNWVSKTILQIDSVELKLPPLERPQGRSSRGGSGGSGRSAYAKTNKSVRGKQASAQA